MGIFQTTAVFVLPKNLEYDIEYTYREYSMDKDNKSAFSSNEYDTNISITLPYYEEMYNQIIDLVHTIKPDIISWLDVGCGTGKMAELALKTFNIDRLVLCDNSAAMLKQAHRKLCDFTSKTEFINIPVQELSETNAFDVITAIQVNHYLNKSDRMISLANCYNALKPGGLFITFENFAPFGEYGIQTSLQRWKNYQITHGKSIADAQKHINRYGREYFPITVTEHLDIMQECGFKTVEVLWLSYMQLGIYGVK